MAEVGGAAQDPRPSAHARGYDSRWERTRRRYLRRHPICECDADCGEPSTVVHHVDGLGPDGPHGHDESNLQALAKRCHDRITAREQPGGWHSSPPRRRPTSTPHPGILS